MLTDHDFRELFPDEAPSATHAIEAAERRRDARIPADTDVVVAAGGSFFTGTSADLSEGGVFVATHRVLDIGTRVSLEMELPTGQLLARGNVKWIRRASDARDGTRPGLGIAFDELSEVDRATLAKFCGGRPRFITYEEVRSIAS